ncbi:peptidase M61 [Glacieibacterium sp.]|uniref:M61 family metallopeptidase n=1 Tax=Glacieibacterium sp. TaxID=2860237 RepID=UPI003B0072D3
MKAILKAFVLTLMASTAAAAAAPGAPSGPLARVLITPSAVDETAGTGSVEVSLTVPDVDVAAGTPLVRIGTIVPGMAGPQSVLDMTVADASGPVPMSMRTGDDSAWIAGRAVKGILSVRYRLPLHNIALVRGGPPIQLRVDGNSFSGVGNTLVAALAIDKPYRVAIGWNLASMGPGARAVSSYGDGDVELPAGPLSRLDSTVFMAGQLKQSPEPRVGEFSAVWGGTPPFDPRPAMLWTARLHGWMSRFFRDEVEPPYRVFIRNNPMNGGGGAALTHSFLVTYGAGVDGENLKSILGHEMTHTWTSNDDLEKWYNEGNAVYYQALLAWRAGLIDDAHYLADLNETASRYYTNALRDTPEDQVAPHFWEDTRIRVLPYDRGAMYFAVLNDRIRKASGGKRSIDDLILAMNARMHAGEKLSEAKWLDLLRAEIGEAGPKLHRSMLAGGLMLPDSDAFGPCFERVVTPIRQFDLGFDNASLLGTQKIVRGLKPGSEAAKAGLRDGDMISYGVALDAVQAEVNRTLALQVTRDGKTFPLTYLPRGKPVEAYQWTRKPGVPEASCKL